jgi:antibiotic biosynthesis monooxygenase (ABM) superfamily enzyme
MKQEKTSNIEPVTVVFSWTVKPGQEENFQNWMHKVHLEASKWPGHLGVTTLRPPKGRSDYQTVLRFDSHKHLQNWLNSKERNKLMEAVDSIAKLHTEKSSGLETWFDIPGQLVAPPPRWKMALTTIIAIYPIALFFAAFVNEHVASWPVFFRAALVPIFGPIILTYLLMPFLTRKVLRNWLYKNR